MSAPVRVAVLGLGQRGLQHLTHVWRLQEQGLAEVIALGDAFADNLAEAKLQKFVPGFASGNIRMTTDFDALLDTAPDALYVCIPPNLHAGQVVRAAQAGIHLFVEKPMSLYLDEAIEMDQAIRDAGILAAVGFQQRYEARHETVRDFLADKRVVMTTYTLHAPLEGHSVKHMHTESAGGPANRVWTASRAWSGTTMVEAGIHPLDLWRYWLGDVEWVQAVYVHRPPADVIDGADNPYAYTALFGFASGAVGNITLSRLRRVYHSDFGHRLLWTEGQLHLEPAELVAYHYDGPYPPQQTPSVNEVRHTLPTPPANNATYEISRAFIQAIAERAPQWIRSPFGDAMNSLAAVLAANVSDELGGQRIDVGELLTGGRYARFRARPVEEVR